MSIIYSYPQITATTDDLLLVSDASSTPKYKTSQTSVSSIKDAIDVVDSLVAGSGISISAATGAVTIGNTGVLSLTSNFGTYISGTNNAAATGAANIGTVDLNAVDGTAVAATRFLSKDNTWDTPPSYTGGANLGYVPSGGSNTTFLRGDGTWVIPDNGISGSGTQYNIPMFATTTTLGDSLLAQDAGATTITFGTAVSGQVLDISGRNRISFSGDSTNTYIAADTNVPENLTIHADQQINLFPDTYVVIDGAGAAPTTASDAADKGTIVYDDNYLYIAVQDDTWKRVALSTW